METHYTACAPRDTYAYIDTYTHHTQTHTGIHRKTVYYYTQTNTRTHAHTHTHNTNSTNYTGYTAQSLFPVYDYN